MMYNVQMLLAQCLKCILYDLHYASIHLMRTLIIQHCNDSHLLSCSCVDYAVHSTACKHVHLICILNKELCASAACKPSLNQNPISSGPGHQSPSLEDNPASASSNDQTSKIRIDILKKKGYCRDLQCTVIGQQFGLSKCIKGSC